MKMSGFRFAAVLLVLALAACGDVKKEASYPADREIGTDKII